MSNDSRNLPPQDLDAERGLLGSLMIVSDAIDVVLPIMEPEYFYLPSHRCIYEAILRLNERGTRAFDAVTVSAELERQRSPEGDTNLDLIGGEEYLIEVLNSVPHAAHAEYYAKIIADKWQLRSLMHLGRTLETLSLEGVQDGEELLKLAGSELDQIQEKNVESLVSVTEGAENWLKWYDSTDPVGISTGFHGVDRILRGLRPGALYILGARPSVGKSAFAARLSDNVAAEGVPVYFVSLEMRDPEIVERLIAQRGKIDSDRLRSKTLWDSERERIPDLMPAICSLPLTFDRSHRITVQEIASKARMLKRRSGLGLLVIDYLQLLAPENPKDIREQQVARMSRQLKQLAGELSIPIVTLAQLNRAVEMRENRRPRLGDLRESGAIEQDADVVMFLHRKSREEIDNDPSSEPVATLIIEKQRGGKTGDVKLDWFPEYMLFENVEQRAIETGNPFASGLDFMELGELGPPGRGESSKGDF